VARPHRTFRANNSQLARAGKVKKQEEFAREIEDSRETTFRFSEAPPFFHRYRPPARRRNNHRSCLHGHSAFSSASCRHHSRDFTTADAPHVFDELSGVSERVMTIRVTTPACAWRIPKLRCKTLLKELAFCDSVESDTVTLYSGRGAGQHFERSTRREVRGSPVHAAIGV
jgi:hypothetical protein